MCGSIAVHFDPVDIINRICPTSVPQVWRRGNLSFGKTVTALFANEKKELQFRNHLWGTLFSNGRYLFNARVETLTQRQMFAESIRRKKFCAIPSSSFFEKGFEFRGDEEVSWLAGLELSDSSLVICTTEAPQEVRRIHGRIPVVVQESSVRDWVAGDEGATVQVQKVCLVNQVSQIDITDLRTIEI